MGVKRGGGTGLNGPVVARRRGAALPTKTAGDAPPPAAESFDAGRFLLLPHLRLEIRQRLLELVLDVFAQLLLLGQAGAQLRGGGVDVAEEGVLELLDAVERDVVHVPLGGGVDD